MASIRIQILLSMLLVGLVPLVVVVFQGQHCAMEGVMELQSRQLTRLVAQQEMTVTAWLGEREKTLALAARSGEIQAATANPTAPDLRGAAAAYLERVRQTQPDLSSLLLVDGAGGVIAGAVGNSHAATDLVRSGLLARLTAGSAVAWAEEPHRHADAGAGLHLGLTVPSHDGAEPLYLLANVELAGAMGTSAAWPDDGSALNLALVDSRTGATLSEPAGGMHGPSAIEPAVVRTPNAMQHMHSADGIDWLAMARPLEAAPAVSVVASLEHAEAYSLVNFLLRRTGGTAVVLTLLVLLVSWPLATRMSGPLRELVRVTRRVASGASEERARHFAAREADELAQAFNAMLDDLARKQRELVHAASLAAVGEWSASIVHEMRNPLNTIQMNLSALEKHARTEPRHAELFDLASRQTDRLQRMLNDLLGFSRQLELSPTAVEPAALLADLVAAHRASAKARGVQIQIDLPAPPPAAIAVDAEQCHRMLANLLDNAILASPTDATVTLRLVDAEGQLLIHVDDAGPGIPEDLRERVFLPFFTTRDGGTGLGLATARKIAESHGGALAIAASPAGGTRVTVTLPRRPEAP